MADTDKLYETNVPDMFRDIKDGKIVSFFYNEKSVRLFVLMPDGRIMRVKIKSDYINYVEIKEVNTDE